MAELHERYEPGRVVRLALEGRVRALAEETFVWICPRCLYCDEEAACEEGVVLHMLMHEAAELLKRRGYHSVPWELTSHDGVI